MCVDKDRYSNIWGIQGTLGVWSHDCCTGIILKCLSPAALHQNLHFYWRMRFCLVIHDHELAKMGKNIAIPRALFWKFWICTLVSIVVFIACQQRRVRADPAMPS